MLKIPCLYMRAGTSKGLFIDKMYLPNDVDSRDFHLLKLMGSPEIRQIDGMGNGDPLTNKVAIINKSTRKDADLDFLFAQIILNERRVSTEANCGNILSGVAPYALSVGMIKATSPITTVKIYNENTDTIIEVVVETPYGSVCYEGDASIDGVPGTGSPVRINFPNSVGSTFGAALPTGCPVNVIDGIEFSLIDVGIPVIFLKAAAFGKTGYESFEELNNDKGLLSSLSSVRENIKKKFNLKSSSLVPKMALLAAKKYGGNLTSRYFTPYTCHSTHAITGGLCLASACFIEGSIANNFYAPKQLKEIIRIEHPAGTLDISIEIESQYPLKISKGGFLRTVRPLFEGYGIIAA